MRKRQGIQSGKYGKRIAGLTMAALLCFPLNVTKILAAQDITEHLVDGNGMGTGYVQMEDFPVESIHDGSQMHFFMASPEQETSYYTPKLPEIKNQKGYETCWAFASVACMETYLLNHGVDEVDLSELHLAYFANHSVVDPLDGTAGDSYSASGNWLKLGGNYQMVENTWADWVGAVKENADAYTQYSQAEAVLSNSLMGLAGMEDSLAYRKDAYHLQGFREIKTADTEDVKKAIVNYGAVAASYCSDVYSSTDLSTDYYNAETHAYYCDQDYQTNHGVAIVGWDDNYSKENFNKTPEKNGAWYVRNSWGESFGEGGYFWISYEDKSLDDAVIAFIPESADNYTHNYQYDGAFWKKSTNVSKPTNIFTAHGSDAEYIKAVSFETQSVNVDYTVRIYLNPTDSVNPETGTLKATVSGQTDYQGMYTVPLSEPVYVEEGDVFAVMVEMTTGGNRAFVMIDSNSTNPNYTGTNTGGVGQSVAYYNGIGWVDYGKKENTNFHIKAYTTDAHPDNRVSVSGISLSDSQATLKAGDTLQLQAEVIPDNAYNTNISWSSSNPAVAKVSGTGLVTAVAAGNAVITATTEDGSYKAYCQINVTVPLQGIRLNYSSVDMMVGEKTKLTVSYEPNDTTDDRTVQWSSSNPGIASVDGGTVTGVAAGKATITARCGSFSVTSEVTVNAVKVSGILISGAPSQLTEGDTAQLTAEIKPSNVTDKSVIWSSSDASVLSVDANGKVTANKAGTAVIKVTDASGVLSATASISVAGKSGTAILSVDNKRGVAVIPDLVTGSNSEVPLAVVLEGTVYRMYNPNSGEHFYTKSSGERDSLINSGWNYEENASFATIGAEEEAAQPVYRVYNPNSGLHHYTMSHGEAIMLSHIGWDYEGISFYAFSTESGKGSAQYRLYNPNDGQHHWTVDANERDYLASIGWNDEGTAWRVK